MTKREVPITRKGGLCPQNADALVRLASSFRSRIFLEANIKKINAKSLMGVMTIGGSGLTKVVVSANGVDEEEAVSALQGFLAG